MFGVFPQGPSNAMMSSLSSTELQMLPSYIIWGSARRLSQPQAACAQIDWNRHLCVEAKDTKNTKHTGSTYTFYRPSTSLYAFPNRTRRCSWYIFVRDPTICARYCTPHRSNMTDKTMFIITPPKSVVRAEYGSTISSSRIRVNFGGNNRITVFRRHSMASEKMSQPGGAIGVCQAMKHITARTNLTVCPH